MPKKLRVAVLMGGKSDEREISLSTGRMILSALNPERYSAIAVDTAQFGGDSYGTKESAQKTDLDAELLALDLLIGKNSADIRPDVAFIALHGKFGEDGTIQGLLELLGIPYVGSGVLASALAMDKVMARSVLAKEGIPVPNAVIAREPVDVGALIRQTEQEIGFPAVVKPSKQGSTIGLSIVRRVDELAGALEVAFKHDDDVLIEEFIEGTEITGAVVGNADACTLPLVEIVPESGFYDYHSKYTPGATEEIVPARIPVSVYRRAEELALACHKILGCRDMSRTDMMVRGDELFVLEVNTIPGMTPTSLLPRAAQAAGMGFPDLLDVLIGFALERG